MITSFCGACGVVGAGLVVTGAGDGVGVTGVGVITPPSPPLPGVSGLDGVMLIFTELEIPYSDSPPSYIALTANIYFSPSLRSLISQLLFRI
ncbi:hypothetical protein D3C75_1240640 [compost metagenome]